MKPLNVLAFISSTSLSIYCFHEYGFTPGLGWALLALYDLKDIIVYELERRTN
jgi:hypothetical protein